MQRVMPVRRDPFELIMWVPEADGPLAECCKLADEIVKRMPDEESYPRPAASVPADILVIPACHEVREGSELSPRSWRMRQCRVYQ